MTLKPMTYLVSFTAFVLLFMGLGGYVGYGKLADHVLTQGFLDAVPVAVQAVTDPQGPGLRWDDRISLDGGRFATVEASSRTPQVAITWSDGAGPALLPPALPGEVPPGGQARTEDVRVDAAHHRLYVRVHAPSSLQAKETTWLYKYDLRGRTLLRRAAVNPAVLPPPFRP